MNSKRVDILINEVSLLTGYSKKEVKEMWMAQWSCLSKTISGANTHDVEFDNIHIMGLAKFYATKKNKRYFYTIKLRREEAMLPDVYPGQRFDMFSRDTNIWIGEAFVRDAAPLYMGRHIVKDAYPRVMEFTGIERTFPGLRYWRLPINKNERDGYI